MPSLPKKNNVIGHVVPLASVGAGVGIFAGSAYRVIKRNINPDLLDSVGDEYTKSNRLYEAQRNGAIFGGFTGITLGLIAYSSRKSNKK